MNNCYAGLIVYNMGLKRTSIEIDEELHAEVKVRAVRRGITIQAALEEALRAWLNLPPAATEEPNPQIRRSLAGLRALYALSDKDSRGMVAMIETGLKAAEVWPPSGRRRRADGE